MTARSKSLSFTRFSWCVLAYNLAVILWGAFVRASGSGAGCGSHWPDCNGEIVPVAPSIATMIEFTHRITSGLALLLVVVQWVWAFRQFPKRHWARRAVSASMFFMVMEAALGAGIVLFEYVADDASLGRAGWMALHLVNTFLLVASLALTAWFADDRGDAQLDFKGGLGLWFFIGASALLVTGAAGAVTALGDTLFPARSLAEGLAHDLSPTAHFLVRLRVIHPIVATLTFMYLAMMSGLVSMQRPEPHVKRAAASLVTIMIIQMAAGLLNLGLLAPVWMQLIHLLLADLAWIAFILFGAVSSASSHARGVPEPLIA
jgi:heme A synthase